MLKGLLSYSLVFVYIRDTINKIARKKHTQKYLRGILRLTVELFLSRANKQTMCWMETDYSKHYALSMEDKMAAGACGRSKNYVRRPLKIVCAILITDKCNTH